MIKKRLVMFMSCILLIFSVSFLFSIALKGSAESPDLFEMSGSVLMKYNGSSEHVTVPASVKAIGKGAFAGNSNLQKVTIPSSVELIDYEAFADCTSLLEVDIPDSVLSIRSSAFAGCEALTDVSIGTGLHELGSGVFAGCKALSDINISPNSDTFTCVDGVLYDADRTIVFQVLAGRDKTYYIMPDTVTELKQYAFWGNEHIKHMVLSEKLEIISAYSCSNASALQSIAMSFNVNEIQMKAFEDCIKLEQIYIPDSVAIIHKTAFDGCDKLQIFANYYSKGASFAKENGIKWIEQAKYALNQAEIEKDEYFLRKEKEAELAKAKAEKEIADAIAESEKGLLGKTQVVGNNAVVFINRYDANVNLGEQVSFDETLKKGMTNGKVADHLFYMEDALAKITLPDETSEIGELSFARTSLKELIIPDGVKSIGYGAFYHCEDLEEVVIPDSVSFIDFNAFEHTAWLEHWYTNAKEDYLIVGDGVLIAYKGKLEAFKKPDGVKCVACEIPTVSY